jgi:hypothetical protein
MAAPPRILLAANQGGVAVVELKLALAAALHRLMPAGELALAVLTRGEADYARRHAACPLSVSSFEEFRAADRPDVGVEIARIARDYRQNWSAVIASERTFIDASMLLGGAGERREPRRYAERLVVDFVRFFEALLTDDVTLVVAQTPDSFMTHALYKVTRERAIPIRGISPGWLTEGGAPGGFLTEDEFLRPPGMRRAYERLRRRALTADERARVERFRSDIVGFDGNKAFYKATGKSFGRSALSPNIGRIARYLSENARRRPEIEYFKVSPLAKLKANVMRLARKQMARRWLGSVDTPLPPHCVFYPIHFQPEASTLVGGVFYTNQIGLIEAVAKSLPLGYTLVLKEHPAGRGTRPAWQYRYLAHYPNVLFSDAPSKEIARHSELVVTITGTIALEAMALDRPVIVFGDWFYDYAEVLYRCKSFDALPDLLRRLLIGGEYWDRRDRHALIETFLLSYLEGLVPAYPRVAGAAAYAAALRDELGALGADPTTATAAE